MAEVGCQFAFLILKYILSNLQNNAQHALLPFLARSNPTIYTTTMNYYDPNYYVSPFSLNYLVAFLQSGARGPTAEELQVAVGLPRDQYLIEEVFIKLLPTMGSNEFIFNFPNKLYVKENIGVDPEFRKASVVNFHSDVENVPFGPNPYAADTINKWVAYQTDNNIQQVVHPNDLHFITALLINVLYFKGRWICSFKKEDTFLDIFYQMDHTISKVETMHKCDPARTFKYAENLELDAKFLKLPLRGPKVAMFVVLPNQKYGIFELEKQINKVLLPQNFTYQHVNISLPKWKIKTCTDVKKILQTLGATKAFNPYEANFNGITNQPMHIDAIIQQVYVDVHENGLGALGGTPRAPSIIPSRPVDFKQFNADHPFLYYIKYGDLVVFAGRVGAPSYF